MLRSSIEVNKHQGRLADTIKAQKCQCIERRGSTAILVKDAGVAVENRRYIYQQYDKSMQYLSNSCYKELKSAVATLVTHRPGYVKFDHVILKELKRGLLGDEDLTAIFFAGA